MINFPESSLTQAVAVAAETSGPRLDFRDGQGFGVYRRFFKRGFDITAIVLALPILLPVVAMLAVLIRRDGGPAFYSQNRLGREGRTFRFWKFRSMVVGAEERLKQYLADNPEACVEWDATQKLKNDPRVTALGRFIRKTSLDELPQLWNVLRGDMSLVGPRPMLPEQRTLYPGRAYFELRPGLTGFWQIGDRNNTTFSARAGYDTRYARRLSFATDLAVLVLTVRVVVRGTGH